MVTPMARHRVLLSSLFVVLAVLTGQACGHDELAGDLPSEPEPELEPQPQPEPVCLAARAVCAADTICGETGCERAFDRPYQVRVTSVSAPGKRDGECPDARHCLAPGVAVYFSDPDEPILVAPGTPAVAEIVVTDGSSLVIEIRRRDCAVELTTAVLRSGVVECRTGATSATLSLVAMPL